MKLLRPLAECAGICALWWLADRLAALLHLPLPGALIGLLALLASFAFKLIHPDQLRAGSSLLLRHLLLFFIPPMLVLRAHPEMLGWLGVKLLAIIVMGTVSVMCVTGWLVQRMLGDDA